jgi:iron complex outermembrane receptor protein
MKLTNSETLAPIACGILTLTVGAQDFSRTLDPLYVRSSPLSAPWSAIERSVSSEAARSPDAAEMMRHLPGAAIVRNGPQTGILQLRGLSGDRVAVRIDGMTITPACPNHMDPPLHYAAPESGDAVELFAGIPPVSAGGDFIGGALSVKSASTVFADESSILTNGNLRATYLGSQDAFQLGTMLGVATRDAGVQYRGSAATADDLRYPGGSVLASGYDMTRHDLTGAWRTARGHLAVDAGFSATRDTGTPALPMDMVKDDAWRAGLTQRETFEWGTLENRLYVHEIDHLMDNYTLRPVSGMAMESPSSSRDFGWRADATLPFGENKLRAGIDLHRNEFDAEQIAITGMFAGKTRDTFEQNRRSRAGMYLDWEHNHTDQWTSRVGLRGDVVTSDADEVANTIMPAPAINADLASFNSSDRSFTGILPAAAAALRFAPDDNTAVELAAAFKSRAPSLVERYLWTPLNASAGQADGRTYLGNLDLDPENSFQLGLGLEKSGDSWRARLTPFYQSVNDYIQGMPIARNDPGGRPVLQYQNIDRAELYGAELEAEWRMHPMWNLAGTLSNVRGRNKETGGDLYRIAPLRGMVDLAFRHDAWESRLECMWAGSQSRVSTIQDETSTPGHAIFNLRLARSFQSGIRIEAGVENLLDKRYTDHLGGVNRVSGGDLGTGERIPGAGRFAYGSVSWEF